MLEGVAVPVEVKASFLRLWGIDSTCTNTFDRRSIIYAAVVALMVATNTDVSRNSIFLVTSALEVRKQEFVRCRFWSP